MGQEQVMAHTDTFDARRSVRRRTIDWRGLLNPPGLSAEDRRKLLRRRLFTGLGAVIAAAAIAAGAWWFLIGANTISTDDAYVDASNAQITPQVDGTVAAVPADDTDRVRRGDPLVIIDQADATIAVAQAEANYGQALRRVAQDFANTDAAAATVRARQADLARAKVDYQRRSALAASGAVSGDELTSARNALDTAQAGVSAAGQQLAAQQAIIQGVDVAHNPEVLVAKAALDKARLDLSRTVLRAPVDGVVAQRNVQVGQRVQVGATLMSVVPIGKAYVNANFKEGQLARVRIGQPVTLTSDLYGSDIVYHGRVVGLGGGTGSAFALIPAQNATGNWIKVVQRLPVRVALDPNELAQHPLRVGLSMTAKIDTAS
jgi:membrane fusion protein (multidrug efflux system)